MDNQEFDKALIAAAFDLAAEQGWSRMRVAPAARRAGLDLGRARQRFAHRAAVLRRFGQLADREALAAASAGSPVRDQIFDMLMRRIDVLQAHRAGMLALFRALPANPPAALFLAKSSVCSMGWILEAAGVSAAGPMGILRAKGLFGVWLWTVRAWRGDESADLAATMAALDQALTRAEQAEAWLHPRRNAAAADTPFGESAASEAEPPPPDAAPDIAPEPPTFS
jgi:AcrR family transcriptional regulator